MRLSICANQSPEDIHACVSGGADAVGVLIQVRHLAEDAVGLDTAAELLKRVPPYVGRYAVTHAVTAEEALAGANALAIDTLQLHDEISPEDVATIRAERPDLRLIKAVPIAETVPDTSVWHELVDALIVDSVDPSAARIGGTGLTHNWDLSAELVRRCPLPVILSGGLRPENTAEAVAAVQPWSVNVNSGVETGGKKSAQKVAAMLNQARQASRGH